MALKFHRRNSSTTADSPVKLQSDQGIFNINIAASTSRELMPIISKPLPLRRAERKNGFRTHSADPPRTPASAPPPHCHSGNTQHENTKTPKSAPLNGDRSATAPHKWKRTLTHLSPHLPLDKKAAISQTIVSNAFALMTSFVFLFELHWNLFLRV